MSNTRKKIIEGAWEYTQDALLETFEDIVDQAIAMCRSGQTCELKEAHWDDGTCMWGCKCTACGERFGYEHGRTWKYCPNCGALVEGR